MARAKSGVPTHRRHKKIMDRAKGFIGSRSKHFKTAHEAVKKALVHSTIGRKQRKRKMRELWIIRINAEVRKYDLSYSKFMHGLMNLGITLDRKMLAELIQNNPKEFGAIVEKVKATK